MAVRALLLVRIEGSVLAGAETPLAFAGPAAIAATTLAESLKWHLILRPDPELSSALFRDEDP